MVRFLPCKQKVHGSNPRRITVFFSFSKLVILSSFCDLCSETEWNIFRKILKREYPNEVKIVSLFTLISCLLAQLKKQKLFETYRSTCKSFQSEVTNYTKKIWASVRVWTMNLLLARQKSYHSAIKQLVLISRIVLISLNVMLHFFGIVCNFWLKTFAGPSICFK